MSGAARLVHLTDLDLLIGEASDRDGRARLGKLGFDLAGLARLEAARARLAAQIEHRWIVLYDRARRRYGRGMTAVRDRVCQGCFVTLPTSAGSRPEADALALCASCGRLLYKG
ncbi:MAG: hypothetical protein HY076_03420 [Candidatus Eisenbacteria bacterium]|uniref:C4-type zinc ribbon domain-containing protein n=1 Tax=Eiseniibacteriota bacterium TaxID=2212470 RepID=A0A9D6QNV4_UNCEI|nr:hypothetical protein [Candidatus Eisenbacteria bacterium]MBI3539304.1 hypothetical protein [Candidatus Eisenbacteria bacterium]